MMEFPIPIYTISMGLPIVYFKGYIIFIFKKYISSSCELLFNNSLFGGQL